MDTLYDVAIIGQGPAGMTAAIYAKRAGLNVVMIESSAPGGKLVKTFEIDNWPGEAHISGVDLAIKMFNHVSELNVDTIYGLVTKIDDDTIKTIHTEDAQRIQAKSIIFASGTVENKMNIKGEEEMIGKGVSFCAVCDGAFYKDKRVLVVGGGNSALEEALYLTQFAQEVLIMIRRDVFRADASAIEHVSNHPKIKILKKHIPLEVIHDLKVSGLRVQNVDTKEEHIEVCDGIFPYIGATPSTQSIQHLAICDENGYLIVNEKMETKCPGIFGAGDVVVKPLRQIVTAVNDGAIAAQMAFHYIKDHT